MAASSLETPCPPVEPPVEPPAEPPVELQRLRDSVRHRLFGAPLQGVRIGRYRLHRCIGRGGMGVVWAAEDDELGRTVAIKLLRPELTTLGVARLDKEARALARLSHPNVVGVFDVGTHDEQRFIAMEYVEGETLRAWLAQPRSLDEILDAFIGAGRGLAAAHAVGLVHRDFKPDNVLVGRDGRARVLDFGLARPPSGEETGPPALDLSADPRATALSMHGVLLGTPAYMAPEQHLGLPADARSDQFSFAVALFEAVFGQPPFSGEDLRTLSLAVVRGVVSRPMGHDVPPWLEHVLLRSLAVEPEERCADMAGLLDVLERGRRRPEAQFDTRQVEAVLERAAQLQGEAPDRPRLSESDLAAIAAEAGIDPAHARQAALEQARADTPKPAGTDLVTTSSAALVPPAQPRAGMQTALHTIRALAVRPSAAAMQHIARELTHSEGKGRADVLGSSMTWRGRSLEVHVDPTANGGRLMLWRKLDWVALRRAWSYTAAGVVGATVVLMTTAESLGLLDGPDGEWIVPVLFLCCYLGARLARRLARRIHARDLALRQARLDFTADRLVALVEAAGGDPG